MKKQELRLYRQVSAFFSLLLRVIINYNSCIHTGNNGLSAPGQRIFVYGSRSSSRAAQ